MDSPGLTWFNESLWRLEPLASLLGLGTEVAIICIGPHGTHCVAQAGSNLRSSSLSLLSVGITGVYTTPPPQSFSKRFSSSPLCFVSLFLVIK